METIRREVYSLATVLGLALVLMLAAALVIPGDLSPWYLIPFVWIGLVAISVGLTLEVPDQARSLVGYVAKGACVGALIGLVSFTGVVLPYLLRIGDRTLDDFGGDEETGAALVLSLFAYVVAGCVIGLVSAAIIGAMRSADPQRR